MISNFTPQPYPLWLVCERLVPRGQSVSPAIELVVGWREVDDEVRPVLASTVGTSCPTLIQDDMVPHFFINLDEADAMRALCTHSAKETYL